MTPPPANVRPMEPADHWGKASGSNSLGTRAEPDIPQRMEHTSVSGGNDDLKTPAVILLICALAGSALCSQTPPSCVIDEGMRDQSFVTFRTELLAALRSRSFDRLRPLLMSDIDASEVGGLTDVVGADAFRNEHRLNDPDSSYWAEFERLASLGGRFQEEGSFCAPYFSCPPPEPESGDVVIVRRDVPAHSGPSKSSPVLTRLSCTVVKPATGDAPARVRSAPDWFGIVLTSGQVAFVPSDAIARPDWFMLFRQKDGEWRLAAIK